ncbi:Heme-binding protein 2 [Penaeus vannamei]|uniref:Heme-binding protein 2 n=1 Tax=Penaeus vannamei TaxID=6689 RepID=A0A3R7QRR3_PENVA|nr:Heme-binding protein 2 [Penaeus vannamei]
MEKRPPIDTFTSQISSFFQTYEEAPYAVTESHAGYEERVYPARKWVCTEHTAHRDDEDVTSSMFWKLFRYISGNNNRVQQEIEMTIPVSTEYTAGTTTNKYEMCFYIGAVHQDDPARPQTKMTVGGYMNDDEDWLEEANRLAELIEANGETVSLSHMYWVGYDAPFKFWNRRNEPATPADQNVSLQDRPEMTVLTRTVGGYMNDDEDWLEEANRLAELIEANGETVSLSHMYWVGYDAPFKFWNRRNEVWFVKN